MSEYFDDRLAAGLFVIDKRRDNPRKSRSREPDVKAKKDGSFGR